MPYSRSVYRNDFDARLAFLLKKCRRANRLRASDSDIRDMVFQCTVLQTSAAIETYLKMVIEGWAQKVRNLSKVHKVPIEARAFLTSKKLNDYFSHFYANGHESRLLKKLSLESDLWRLMNGDAAVSILFEGKLLHDATAYPSYKNIKKLFNRLGIPNIEKLISKILKRDAETLIENFQSIRTALAHSSPPPITIQDVESRLFDMKSLVQSLDRIFCAHVTKHCGSDCWT